MWLLLIKCFDCTVYFYEPIPIPLTVLHNLRSGFTFCTYKLVYHIVVINNTWILRKYYLFKCRKLSIFLKLYNNLKYIIKASVKEDRKKKKKQYTWNVLVYILCINEHRNAKMNGQLNFKSTYCECIETMISYDNL